MENSGKGSTVQLVQRATSLSAWGVATGFKVVGFAS